LALVLFEKKQNLNNEVIFKECLMPNSKLYVGNLKYSVTNDQLAELFAQYGTVVEANVIEGKGFGFVEMSNSQEAKAAQEALNGTDFEGRPLKIDEARPPRPKQSRY
jgi:RNA recognition motif-containing protein